MLRKLQIVGSVLFICILVGIMCRPLILRMMNIRFEDYEDLYMAVVSSTSGPGADDNFSELPPSLRAMYCVAVLDMEILNGGVSQFFINDGDVMDGWVAESLRIVGLAPIAGLYEDFVRENRIDPGEIHALFWEEGRDFAELCARYPSDDFDGDYMELRESLDLEQAMLDYANAHPESLPG